MSNKLKAVLGILGITTLAVWLQKRSQSAGPQGPSLDADTDDDSIADIIKRARPALEYARRHSEA